MALITEQVCAIRGDWLIAEVTYDDVTFRIERIRTTVKPPSGIRVSQRINKDGEVWRVQSWETPTRFDDIRPLDGGVEFLDDLGSLAFAWERI